MTSGKAANKPMHPEGMPETVPDKVPCPWATSFCN